MRLLSFGLLLAATSTTFAATDVQQRLTTFQLQLPSHPVKGRDYWKASNGEFIIRSKTTNGSIYFYFTPDMEQKRITSYDRRGNLKYLWEQDSPTMAHSMETFRHNDGLVSSYVWTTESENSGSKWVLTAPNSNHGDVQPYWKMPKPPRH